MAKTKKGKFRGKVSKNAQRQQEQTSSFGHLQIPSGVQVFKEPTSGRMMIDIIPYEVTDPKHPDRDDDVDAAQVGDLWYRRPYKVHRNIGTDGVSLVCPTTAGKKCPICEYRALRLKEGASYKDQEMKDLKPKDRSLYAVIPIDMNKYDEEIHIWDMSDFLFQRQLNEELMEDDENDDFPDLEEGKTLKLRLSEESFGQNKYGKVTRVDFEEREEPYGEDILDEVPNLDKVIRIPNYKEVERTFYELDDEDESEPAAEEGVRDPDDDGEGEEEERPRRKKKSADSGETNRRRTRKSDDDAKEAAEET